MLAGYIIDYSSLKAGSEIFFNATAWTDLQQTYNIFQMIHLNRSDLSLLQLIKSGREGVYYKAKMIRGTCKGHTTFTCKVSKESKNPIFLWNVQCWVLECDSVTEVLQAVWL